MVDDGSTDGTASVVGGFSCPTVPIRYVRQPNKGVACARNRGAGLAISRRIAFLDADDVWLRYKLGRQLTVFDQVGCKAVSCGFSVVDEDLNILATNYAAVDETVDALLLFRNDRSMLSSGLVVDADFFQSIGGFNETLSTSADWDIAIRIAERTQLRCVPEPLLLYRQHGNGMHRDVTRMEYEMRVAFASFFRRSGPAARHLRRRAWSRLLRVLGASYLQDRSYADAIRCGLASAIYHPSVALDLISAAYTRCR